MSSDHIRRCYPVVVFHRPLGHPTMGPMTCGKLTAACLKSVLIDFDLCADCKAFSSAHEVTQRRDTLPSTNVVHLIMCSRSSLAKIIVPCLLRVLRCPFLTLEHASTHITLDRKSSGVRIVVLFLQIATQLHRLLQHLLVK